jgi:paired amphipathic helix protein Sin3a
VSRGRRSGADGGAQVAYHVFTLDKLLGALIKQVQTILADAQTPALLELLKRERGAPAPGPTRDDRARYLWDVRQALPEENVFRIDWDAGARVMSMQLLGRDEDEEADEGALFERWQAYVDAFVSTEAQSPVRAPVRLPFLRRSLRGAGGTGADVLALGGLAMKVCVRTYRLFFVPGSEDVLVSQPGPGELEHAERGARAADARRARWMADADAGRGVLFRGVEAGKKAEAEEAAQ